MKGRKQPEIEPEVRKKRYAELKSIKISDLDEHEIGKILEEKLFSGKPRYFSDPDWVTLRHELAWQHSLKRIARIRTEKKAASKKSITDPSWVGRTLVWCCCLRKPIWGMKRCVITRCTKKYVKVQYVGAAAEAEGYVCPRTHSDGHLYFEFPSQGDPGNILYFADEV
jgi:hypothetical protein